MVEKQNLWLQFTYSLVAGMYNYLQEGGDPQICSDKWLIQVKSSSNIPRLKAHQLNQLRKMAKIANGQPVIATVQHKDTVIVSSKGSRGVPTRGIARSEGADLASYGIFFYSLDWEIMYPV